MTESLNARVAEETYQVTLLKACFLGPNKVVLRTYSAPESDNEGRASFQGTTYYYLCSEVYIKCYFSTECTNSPFTDL